MQIQLCEDDGLFHEGGTPQIVILLVKFDNGKAKRIPYPAEKTIAALYQDLRAIAPQVEQGPQENLSIQDIQLEQTEALKQAMPLIEAKYKDVIETLRTISDKSNTIEKEDIVTLVKMNPRDTVYSGTISPLIIGMDYRVLAVLGPKIPTPDGRGIRQVIQGFEVIDDNAATPERMIVTPDEVVLKNKRMSKIIEKVSTVEEILPCPACQVNNSLTLKGTDFVGVCSACNVDITIARVIRKCLTPKCGKNVSCFDVGGKYEGKCSECKSSIEVPYE